MTYMRRYSAIEEIATAKSTRANIPNAAVVAAMASGVHCIKMFYVRIFKFFSAWSASLNFHDSSSCGNTVKALGQGQLLICTSSHFSRTSKCGLHLTPIKEQIAWRTFSSCFNHAVKLGLLQFRLV